MSPSRTILHVDMDAFFASVEQRDFPELRGKPVVVGGPADQRGVVSAASYEARKFGIHSAMPLREAYRRCPHAVFQPGRMQAYRQASRQIFKIFESFTPLVQGLSVDEAFLDVTGALHLWQGEAVRIAQALRADIKSTCDLTASVGIAPNKFLAKLASDMDKPDGLTVVPFDPQEVEAFLAPLPIERLWGVGKKSAERLKKRGLHTVYDLQQLGEEKLTTWLGESYGPHLYALAMGRDERLVSDRAPEKSISAEHTYSENQAEPEVWHQTLVNLTEKVGRRLRKTEFWATCVQIKIRSHRFQTYTRQRHLPLATRRDLDILEVATELLEAFHPEWPVRLLGVGVTGLQINPPQKGQQLDLFTEAEELKSTRLDEAVDAIREKYGALALKRGRWSSRDT